MRRLPALIGPKPKEQQPKEQQQDPPISSANKPKSQRPTLHQIFAPQKQQEQREPTLRPPAISITRKKTTPAKPPETSQNPLEEEPVDSGRVAHLPPPSVPPSSKNIPPANSNQTVEIAPKPPVPQLRKPMDAIAHIRESLIPPIFRKKNSIGSVRNTTRKQVLIAILAGVALGMAGNAAYYYHTTQQQEKTPAPEFDNSEDKCKILSY